MYGQNLELNKLQCFMCHKIQTTKQILITFEKDMIINANVFFLLTLTVPLH